HERALAFTRGHPLALALLADVAVQSDGVPAEPVGPQVLGVLLRSLVGSAPTSLHRTALEASSQVLVTTEPLLAAMLGIEDAQQCAVSVVRSADGAPAGLIIAPTLNDAAPSDPAVRAARRHLGDDPAGEVLLVRHWLDGHAYQSVSAVVTCIMLHLLRRYLTT